MRKTKPAKRRPATKRTALKKAAKRPISPTTVEQYIAAANAAARPALKQIRAAILSVVPAESVEIISYQIPAFRHKKVLVWYAAFNEHCSLFPTAAVVGQFKDELRGYSTSKGTVHFPLSKPMPVTLIRKMVQARLARTA
ncbi:MAG TPA: DUF1801 domain-containing protein [Candidatus Angelobacter sp.]|jgi:uncharacterized protein YdhG (YjbR/CyaY superfamily)